MNVKNPNKIKTKQLGSWEIPGFMDQYQVSWIFFLGDSDVFFGVGGGGDLSWCSLYSLPNKNLADFCVF